MARIYPDSKTFVDMKMKFSKNETLSSFQQFLINTSNNPNNDQIAEWVEENFEERGNEFEQWEPTDWTNHPAILNKIENEDYKKFASRLNEIWHDLGRQMKEDVKNNDEQYSIIYVENPVIVPGDRFQEFYYWDSYWIILGLLHSEMFHVRMFWLKATLNKFLFTLPDS